MNNPLHRIVLGLLSIAAAAGLSSCATGLERRIERNPQIYSQLSGEERALVAQGRIREGMSKGAVFLAWGKPARVSAGKRKGQTFEHWTYVGYDPVWVNSYGGGWGRGYYYDIYDPFYNPGPTVEYIPYDAAFAEFIGNRVTAWGAPKR